MTMPAAVARPIAARSVPQVVLRTLIARVARQGNGRVQIGYDFSDGTDGFGARVSFNFFIIGQIALDGYYRLTLDAGGSNAYVGAGAEYQFLAFDTLAGAVGLHALAGLEWRLSRNFGLFIEATPGVLLQPPALAFTVIVFWLLIQFNRSVRVMRDAAERCSSLPRPAPRRTVNHVQMQVQMLERAAQRFGLLQTLLGEFAVGVHLPSFEQLSLRVTNQVQVHGARVYSRLARRGSAPLVSRRQQLNTSIKTSRFSARAVAAPPNSRGSDRTSP